MVLIGKPIRQAKWLACPSPKFSHISSISKINSNESKRFQRNKNSIIPIFLRYKLLTDHLKALFNRIKAGISRFTTLFDRIFFNDFYTKYFVL